jgi:hypothetical protein
MFVGSVASVFPFSQAEELSSSLAAFFSRLAEGCFLPIGWMSLQYITSVAATHLRASQNNVRPHSDHERNSVGANFPQT